MKVSRLPLMTAFLAAGYGFAGAAIAQRGETLNNRYFGSESNARLEDAHRAFLEGKYAEMSLALKDVLSELDLDDATRLNALDLLDQAYQDAGSGRALSEWKVPNGMTQLRVTTRHTESRYGTEYRVIVKGDLAARGLVTQIRMASPSGLVLVDRAQGVGQWMEDKDEDGEHVRMKSETRREPPPAGVYFLEFGLANGETVRTYVILNHHAASTAPEVLYPQPDATVTTATPTISWADYRSPELKPWEYRAVSVWIDRLPAYDAAWDKWTDDMSRTTMTVGESGGHGTTALDDGSYELSVCGIEIRHFGEIKVRREAIRTVPMTVNTAR